MINRAPLLSVCLIVLAGLPAQANNNHAEPAETLTVYWVGNSLVRSITPTRLHELVAERGIDLQFGSQLKGGFSLVRHWDSGADPEYELHQAIVAIKKRIDVRPISINPAYGPPAGQLLELFRRHYPVVRGDDDAEQVLAQHRDTATAEELIGRLNQAIAQNKWLLVAGHGIRTELGREAEADPNFIKNGKRRDGYRPVEYSVMGALCKAVDQQRDKLFIGCYGDVGTYVRQRKAANIKIINESETQIVLDITHSLDPKVFDYPLTLKISLKNAASVTNVTQSDTVLEQIRRGGETIVNVKPNGGLITVTLN